MSVHWGNDGSARSGMRRKLREARERDRRLTMRHRWYAGGIATLLSGALIFTGVTPAIAEETPAPTPSATTEATPPAEEATPPAETPAEPAPSEPSPAPEEPAPAPAPSEETAEPSEPPADEPKTDESKTDEPKTDQTQSRLAPTEEAGVGVLSVPTPGAGEAVITVKVGSDRTGITGVTNLAGVTLLLNTGNNSPSGTRPCLLYTSPSPRDS